MQANLSQMDQQQLSFNILTTLIKTCFDDCKFDFNSAEFNNNERTCLTNCAVRNAQGQRLIQEVNQELQNKFQGSGSFQ